MWKGQPLSRVHPRKLRRADSPLRYTVVLSRMYVPHEGRKRRDARGGQKEPDDNPDKLARVMKTEPRVWLNKHREAQINERTRARGTRGEEGPREGDGGVQDRTVKKGRNEGRRDIRRICDFSDLSLILLPINLSRLGNTLRPGYCPPFLLLLSSVFPPSFPSFAHSLARRYDAGRKIYPPTV